MRCYKKELLVYGILAVILWPTTTLSNEKRLEGYLDMPLQDLLAVKVISVSKKSQTIDEIAAAVHVITNRDIHRSGATNIPDLLRMVPGMNVAQIDANKWAVSSRGFNGIWADKLLVMIDGRSIYTTLSGGVYWDIQNIPLEIIDHIEVIRGPGGTVWGANAVNGVINIITRSANDTQGGALNVIAGNEESRVTYLYGNRLEKNIHYRVYADGLNHDSSELTAGGDARDSWDMARAGFRADWRMPGRQQFMLQADVYDGANEKTSSVDSLTAPFNTRVETEEEVRGVNMQGRWQQTLSDNSKTTFQAYYTHDERDALEFDDKRDTFDLDFQHQLKVGKNQEIVWGIGYRHVEDDTRGSRLVSAQPASREDKLYSVFIQDEIILQPDHLRWIIGSKFEHNGYTGFEAQPGTRLLWTPDKQQVVWGAISRAVRTPSRANQDFIITNTFAAFPVPGVIQVSGTETYKSSTLIAYELGYRRQFNRAMSLDSALFYNDYEKLLGTASGAAVCQPSATPPPCLLPGDTHLLIPSTFVNNVSGNTYGVELSIDWRPSDRWHVQTSYSFLKLSLDSAVDSAIDETPEGLSPKHQLSLRTSVELSTSTEMDIWLRYVDELPAINVPSYTEMDLRLAKDLSKGLELAVVARNLLDSSHAEFITTQNSIPPTEVERSLYLQLLWKI